MMNEVNVNDEIYDGEVHQNFNNIVEEAKEEILDEPEPRNKKSDIASDEDIRKTIEMINPDASSMESRG